MTENEVTVMLAEAIDQDKEYKSWHISTKHLMTFAAMVAAKSTEEANARANASWTLMCKKMVAIEREACAKVCEDYGRAEEMQAIGNDYAAAIRARGEQA